MVRRFKGLVAGAAVLAACPAYAVDGMSFEYGDSDSSQSDVQLYRVGVQWKWSQKWLPIGNWHLGGYWDASLGYWDNQSAGATHSSIFDLGLTPVFRFQQTTPSAISPYAEIGLGFHFLSHTSVSPQRQFGTSFQFGDHLGVGLRFGERGQYDLGYRFQHLSNAGIKQPNDGINFHQVRLQYHF